jgi:hypothetical protein
MDIPTLAGILSVIGDGLFWRRVVDPAFDGRNLVPATVQVLAGLLKPVPQTSPESRTTLGSDVAANQTSGDRS